MYYISVRDIGHVPLLLSTGSIKRMKFVMTDYNSMRLISFWVRVGSINLYTKLKSDLDDISRKQFKVHEIHDYCHVLNDYRRVLIGNLIYWTLLQPVTTIHTSLPHTQLRFFVMASNDRRSSSSGLTSS
jgi:hypothetical protein